jgi:hypothetical protein
MRGAAAVVFGRGFAMRTSVGVLAGILNSGTTLVKNTLSAKE